MIADKIKDHYVLFLIFGWLGFNFDIFNGVIVAFCPKILKPLGSYQVLFFRRLFDSDCLIVERSVPFLLKLLINFTNVPVKILRIKVLYVNGEESREAV